MSIISNQCFSYLLELTNNFRENCQGHLVLPPDRPDVDDQRLHVRLNHHQAFQTGARKTEAQFEVAESKK